MKRSLLVVTIFGAFLVGCAASAMHFAAPMTAEAQNTNRHVRPDSVTGPCYKPGGTDCAATYHFVHGQVTLDTYNSCATGDQCGFTSGATLSGSADFANTNYDCHGLGTDSYSDGVVMQVFPGTTSNVSFGFRNETGRTISSGTSFTINFTCDGA